MTYRKILLSLLFSAAFAFSFARAESGIPGCASPTVLDSLPAGVSVKQSEMTLEGFRSHLEYNAGKMFSGYRVRIFFESDKDSRTNANSAAERFRLLFPDIPMYYSFNNPYFSVTVGDYRTRVDAENSLEKFREFFPDAFIVREKFKYPLL